MGNGEVLVVASRCVATGHGYDVFRPGLPRRDNYRVNLVRGLIRLRELFCHSAWPWRKGVVGAERHVEPLAQMVRAVVKGTSGWGVFPYKDLLRPIGGLARAFVYVDGNVKGFVFRPIVEGFREFVATGYRGHDVPEPFFLPISWLVVWVFGDGVVVRSPNVANLFNR